MRRLIPVLLILAIHSSSSHTHTSPETQGPALQYEGRLHLPPGARSARFVITIPSVDSNTAFLAARRNSSDLLFASAGRLYRWRDSVLFRVQHGTLDAWFVGEIGFIDKPRIKRSDRKSTRLNSSHI